MTLSRCALAFMLFAPVVNSIPGVNVYVPASLLFSSCLITFVLTIDMTLMVTKVARARGHQQSQWSAVRVDERLLNRGVIVCVLQLISQTAYLVAQVPSPSTSDLQTRNLVFMHALTRTPHKHTHTQMPTTTSCSKCQRSASCR